MIQTFLQHNTHHVLHRFRYFVLPQASTRRHKYWIYQTICQAKPIKFIIKLCTDHYNLWDNTLPIKNCVCKSCSLSKLDSTVNNNSIFNTKYADFTAKLQVLLHFQNPICSNNHPYNLHQKFVLLQSIFTSLLYPYLFTNSSLQSLLILPSSTNF